MGQRIGGARALLSLGLMTVANLFGQGAIEGLAYTPTLTQTGSSVRWVGTPKLDLVGNPSNQNGISSADFFSIATQALQRWKAASVGTFLFDYWQGAAGAKFSVGSEYDGRSVVYFTSANDRDGDPQVTSAVLGLTQVWFNTETGAIYEADIALNDRDFRFTTNPRDTSGTGSTQALQAQMNGLGAPAAKPTVYLGNVLTHELGHAVGLSHSGGLASTMLFVESPEQSHLSCDDQAGIRALYPQARLAGETGEIRGRVLNSQGVPVFGAHVVAVSIARGTVLASTLTDPQGNYAIKPLEEGKYALLIEPYYAGAGSLPSYYSSIVGNFSRAFLTDSDLNRPKLLEVRAGSGVDAGEFRVSAASGVRAAVRSLPTALSLDSFPELVSGARTQASDFAVIDRAGASGTATRYYRLSEIEGDLDLRVLSYSLYSPIQVSLGLFDSEGQSVSAEVQSPTYQGESGFANYDASLRVRGLPRGNYVLGVRGSSLNSVLFPAATVAVDSVPFVLITGQINGSVIARSLRAPSESLRLAGNSRCKMAESFPTYVSPSQDPPVKEVSGSNGPRLGFCGSVKRVSESSPSRRFEQKLGRSQRDLGDGSEGEAASFAELFGWFLPWILMLVIVQVMKLLPRRQSVFGEKNLVGGCQQ